MICVASSASLFNCIQHTYVTLAEIGGIYASAKSKMAWNNSQISELQKQLHYCTDPTKFVHDDSSIRDSDVFCHLKVSTSFTFHVPQYLDPDMNQCSFRACGMIHRSKEVVDDLKARNSLPELAKLSLKTEQLQHPIHSLYT